MVIKGMNRIKRKEDEKAKEPTTKGLSEMLHQHFDQGYTLARIALRSLRLLDVTE